VEGRELREPGPWTLNPIDQTNETNETDEVDETNQTNQINEMNEIDENSCWQSRVFSVNYCV
jgi:hypothetical protein